MGILVAARTKWRFDIQWEGFLHNEIN